jgi:hypothetical protein
MPLPPEARDLVAATLAAARRGGALLDRIADLRAARECARCRWIWRASGGSAHAGGPALPDRGGAGRSASTGFAAMPVLLDPGMLQDALVNLILNARDAWGQAAGDDHGGAPAGAATPGPNSRSAIRARVFREALERGLDPFFTTKGGEGSGLGLAMVYDRSSWPGGRAAGNTAQGRRASRCACRCGRCGMPHAPGLVLLVEDSDPIRESVREMLRDLGHAVIEAASADEAEALANCPGST